MWSRKVIASVADQGLRSSRPSGGSGACLATLCESRRVFTAWVRAEDSTATHLRTVGAPRPAASMSEISRDTWLWVSRSSRIAPSAGIRSPSMYSEYVWRVFGLRSWRLSCRNVRSQSATSSESFTVTPWPCRDRTSSSAAVAALRVDQRWRRMVLRRPSRDGRSTANPHRPCLPSAASCGHRLPSSLPCASRQGHRHVGGTAEQGVIPEGRLVGHRSHGRDGSVAARAAGWCQPTAAGGQSAGRPPPREPVA
ncbi:hypothetical protein JOF36_001564 [Pseudonocardia parietis]|uniref:Uncharacterized protein n=1 Tax=Pseudonocardia parietis TaxID=570936 RepID=A0ABS4VPL5_9PSEU|nr:hypothetical protein [Pseudonocardia parietis]